MTDSNGHMNPNNPGSAAAPVARNITNYIIASVVELFCCGGIFGLVALVFSLLAKGSFDRGDVADGESKLRIAKILLIIGVILGVIGVVVAIIANVVMAGSTALTTTTTRF